MCWGGMDILNDELSGLLMWLLRLLLLVLLSLTLCSIGCSPMLISRWLNRNTIRTHVLGVVSHCRLATRWRWESLLDWCLALDWIIIDLLIDLVLTYQSLIMV